MNRLSMFARVQEHYLGLRLPAALWPALAIVAFGVWASRDSETPITLPSNVIISSAEAVGLPASASVADADHTATADDSHTRLEAPIKVERNERVQRWRVLHPGLVRSKFGASARVAHMHTAKFQCLVDWLDDQGFRIKSMGGIAKRPFAGSLHPIGAALDIDQASRNRLFHGKRYPAGTNEAAANCGLMHGDRTVWPNHPDYGHFQVAGVSRGHFARRHRAPTTTATASDVQHTSSVQTPEDIRRVRYAARTIGQAVPPAIDAMAVK